MKGWIVLGLAFMATLSAPDDLWAQRNAQVQDRAELERRLRNRFGNMVMEQLSLSEEDGRAFNGVLRDFQERRELLTLRESQLRRRLLDQGQLNPQRQMPLLSEEDAAALLEEMASIQDEESALFREEQTALLELLTVPQLLRFYAMREALAERINQLRRGPPAGGRRGGGLGALGTGGDAGQPGRHIPEGG